MAYCQEQISVLLLSGKTIRKPCTLQAMHRHTRAQANPQARPGEFLVAPPPEPVTALPIIEAAPMAAVPEKKKPVGPVDDEPTS
jgi:hypothetical protein